MKLLAEKIAKQFVSAKDSAGFEASRFPKRWRHDLRSETDARGTLWHIHHRQASLAAAPDTLSPRYSSQRTRTRSAPNNSFAAVANRRKERISTYS